MTAESDLGPVPRGRAPLACTAGLGISFALLSGAAPGQPPPEMPPRFQRYGIADGLSQSSVTAIARDSRGFLWIGTREGVDRYDGYDFLTYRHSPGDAGSLSPGVVVAIATAPGGDLWIGTSTGGLDRYDVDNDRFEHFPLNVLSGEPNGAEVLAVVAARSGRVWVGTTRGLYVLDPAASTAGYSAVLGDRVQALAEDAAGRIVAATGGGQLIRVAPDTLAAHHEQRDLGAALRAVTVDERDTIWAGFDSGEFVRIEASGKSTRHVLDAAVAPRGARIRALATDRLGRLWLGGLGFGVARYDPATGTTVAVRHRPLDRFSLSSDDVASLTLDADGTLWVGTLTGGLNRASLEVTGFAHYWHQPGDPHSLSHAAVTAFAAATDGTLWVGTDGGGLNRLDRRSGRFEVYRADPALPGSLPHDRVWSLALDSAADLWVGTWGGGLAVRRAGETPFQPLHELPGRIVTVLVPDGDALWVGTADAGLARIGRDGRLMAHYRYVAGDAAALSSDNITAVYVDRTARVWVGTWNAGLNRLDPGAQGVVRFAAAAPTQGASPRDSIRAIAQDDAGTVWLGTGGGLARLVADASTFDVFGAAQGLPAGTIYGVVPDSSGDLWLTSNHGIVRFSPRSGNVRIFGPDDGAQSYEFNGGASLRLPDDTIAFGGINGFNLFHPGDIRAARPPHPVAITAIRVLGQPLLPRSRDLRSPLSASTLVADRLELPHASNVLEIDFVSPLPHDPDQQRYAFRLDGFDQDWRHAGARRRTATYTNLSPGAYRFHVRSANGDGVWSGADRTISIAVRPPWWSTTWAWAAYAVAALLVAIAVERRRTIVLRRRAQLLREQVRRRTSELVAKTAIIEEQSSRLREALATKERLFARVSHEFRTPLTLVLGPVDGLLERESDPNASAALQLMRRNARRLLRLVDDLLGLAGLTREAPSAPEPLRLAPRIRAIVAAFESVAARRRLEITSPVLEDVWARATDELFERIVTNLVSNAVKYSPGPGTIEVSLVRVDDRARVTVTDCGPGVRAEDAAHVFDPFYRADLSEPGTGLGLALVRESVTALGGTVGVSSAPGDGATFTVELPACPQPAVRSDEPRPEAPVTLATHTHDVVLSELDAAESEAPEASVRFFDTDGDERPRVLVIEDNADLRALIVDVLGVDHRCGSAADGADGVRIALEEIPDLVVCDVMMPGVDGFEVTRRLKMDPRTCHVPIVLLTALGDRPSRLAGLAERADDYIVKPFDAQELALRVRNLIETRRIARRAAAHRHVASEQSPTIEGLGPRDHAFLERLDAAVTNHYQQIGCSTADLARDLAMSERQLQRKLRALLDTTPADYLREFRLNQAARWLLEGQPAGTVALDVGFATQSHFTECFKARFGATPGEYASSRERPTPEGRRRR